MLKIDPESRLQFTRTPTSGAPTKTLTISNTHSENVAFKVKTTVPKLYLVRPSWGTLKQGQQQEIQIVMQQQAVGETYNHRFMVQAVPVGDTEHLPREAW